MRDLPSCSELGRLAAAALTATGLAALLAIGAAGCSGDDDSGTAGVPGTPGGPACGDRTATRQPLFGDLHVHTRHSFDAYTFGNHDLSPADAYRFARGEELVLPPHDVESVDPAARTASLATPLDFAGVTDHSEFLGEVSICSDPSAPGFESLTCRRYRTETARSIDPGFLLFGTEALRLNPGRGVLCARPGVDCQTASDSIWARNHAMTEAADEPCSFTALHAYEWSGTPLGANLHRNVVFASASVPGRVTSYIEEPTPEGLWAALDAACTTADGCEYVSIPHNSNISRGVMFGLSDDLTAAEAATRHRAEPLVEMVQMKGQSECKNGFALGHVAAVDEECGFENYNLPRVEPLPICLPGQDPLRDGCVSECDGTFLEAIESGDAGAGGLDSPGCQDATDFVRGALKEGLAAGARLGTNPLAMGFIGSTDTHNGNPGATEEDAFRGAHGELDADPVERLEGIESRTFNPGGLAVVYAEENTRASIFAGLRRRETYATSGTRIVLRVFGGWDLPADLPDRRSFLVDGYGLGVPMGGDLPAPPDGDAAPTFAVRASRSPDTDRSRGTPLHRLQVIKVWVDAEGSHERVDDVAVSGDGGAVDLATCGRSFSGADELAGLYTDPDFDPGVAAAWYVRVLEDRSCRWSQWDCIRLPEGERPALCQDPEAFGAPPTIRERAWSSPIFYTPPAGV